MDVRHNDLSPVFIIGHGSSGTSILSRLFREYLRIAFGTESQFFVRYYRRLSRYGDLSRDRNLFRLVRHISQERWFHRSGKFGFATSAEAIFADVRQRTYRGVLEAVFRQLAEHFQTPRWGDKTPEYVHHLPVLWELFPDGKYIHLVRDGRDVALSVMGRYWGAKNVFAAAGEWREAIALVDAFLVGLPANQRLEISYEGLLSDPGATFARIVTFLGIENSDGRVLDSIREPVSQALMRDNFDKWRTRLSRKQCIQFEQIAGDALRQHGYETVGEQTEEVPSMAQRAYWRCDNLVRKWCYPHYWQDNLYKAGLRTRDALRCLRPL